MTSLAQELRAHVLERLVSDDRKAIALVGLSSTAIDLLSQLREDGLGPTLLGIFDPSLPEGREQLAEPWTRLGELDPDLIVICSDREKELLLRASETALHGQVDLPDAVLAGTAHLAFDDPLFDELDAPALVPSYATGHPHTRIHLYQCLKAAAAHELRGAVVEFGAFKGGTTAWLARLVSRLNLRDSPVIGFDTWQGFPARQSLFDLYRHPRCKFDDIDAVRAYVEPVGAELVVGDIANTAAARLQNQPVLLAFLDTDNYTAARAALQAVLPNLVPGGTVVLDHFATSEAYLYTVGERMAAHEVLGDLLHVHGTGVFVKLR